MGETNKISADNKAVLLGMLIIFFTISLIIFTCWVGYYYSRQLNINNFQTTIKDLSDEQKCLHICGFQFDSILENYKFCVEKCDRISERINENIKK